jgi:hypothetical protein
MEQNHIYDSKNEYTKEEIDMKNLNLKLSLDLIVENEPSSDFHKCNLCCNIILKPLICKDCETLFGKGTMWTDYDSQGSAKKAIDSMSNTGSQLYRSGKVHGLTNHDSVGMSKPSYGKPHGPNDYMAN